MSQFGRASSGRSPERESLVGSPGRVVERGQARASPPLAGPGNGSVQEIAPPLRARNDRQQNNRGIHPAAILARPLLPQDPEGTSSSPLRSAVSVAAGVQVAAA